MKKGKVFGKSQIAVAVMLLALGGAVWLNMKYTPSSGKYLGEASYVSGKSSVSAVETSAKAERDSGDYFTDVKKEREGSRKKAQESIEETLKAQSLPTRTKNPHLQKLRS